jgi:hypothetical protein
MTTAQRNAHKALQAKQVKLANLDKIKIALKVRLPGFNSVYRKMVSYKSTAALAVPIATRPVKNRLKGLLRCNKMARPVHELYA